MDLDRGASAREASSSQVYYPIEMQMENLSSALIFEKSLTRAAEKFGDITLPVIELYYRRFPQAKADFDYHGFGKPEKIQGDMVHCVVYYLMEWLEQSSMTQISFRETACHHFSTLRISQEHFEGLIDATLDIIGKPIPDSCRAEYDVLMRIRSDFKGICDHVSKSNARAPWCPGKNGNELAGQIG